MTCKNFQILKFSIQIRVEQDRYEGILSRGEERSRRRIKVDCHFRLFMNLLLHLLRICSPHFGWDILDTTACRGVSYRFSNMFSSLLCHGKSLWLTLISPLRTKTYQNFTKRKRSKNLNTISLWCLWNMSKNHLKIYPSSQIAVWVSEYILCALYEDWRFIFLSFHSFFNIWGSSTFIFFLLLFYCMQCSWASVIEWIFLNGDIYMIQRSL